jgi:hypothetical protein
LALKFGSKDEIKSYFGSLGLQQQVVDEIDSICCGLCPGECYHRKLFLPDVVSRALYAPMDDLNSEAPEPDTAPAGHPQADTPAYA